MLEKIIYAELVAIIKEIQARRNSLECTHSAEICISDGSTLAIEDIQRLLD